VDYSRPIPNWAAICIDFRHAINEDSDAIGVRLGPLDNGCAIIAANEDPDILGPSSDLCRKLLGDWDHHHWRRLRLRPRDWLSQSFFKSAFAFCERHLFSVRHRLSPSSRLPALRASLRTIAPTPAKSG
jgi:hypothetical protein